MGWLVYTNSSTSGIYVWQVLLLQSNWKIKKVGATDRKILQVRIYKLVNNTTKSYPILLEIVWLFIFFY